MIYDAKKFENLQGIKGLSDKLLEAHLGLYEGYAKNVQKVADSISQLAAENKLDAPEYAELKRRAGWEWNGMRLHEYYFSNISKEPRKIDDNSTIAIQIKKDFGSFEAWEKDFRAMGAMRGIGWVILYFDPAAGKLTNVWINEHDAGHLAGAVPILVMDVFEHAYMTDYGTKKADYVGAFMNVIDWEVAEKRFDNATRAIDSRPKGIDHIGCRC